MTRAALSTLTLAALSGVNLAAPDCEDDGPPAGSTFMEVDVLSYDYTFDVTTRQGTSTVTLAALTAGECVSLDFRQPDAASILLDGAPVAWSQTDGAELQVCGDSRRPGDTFTVNATLILPVATEGQTDIGYSVSRDVDGYLHHYLLSWFEGCSLFGPCYDDPDDFATYAFHVTHPVGYKLLCPGVLTAGDTRSSCALDTEAPTYTGFGFTLSPGWVRTPLGSVDGVAVEMWDLFGVQAAEQLDMAAFSGYFRWIQQQLGTYPYGDRLRFALGPNYWWGFEHPGNVALAEDLAGVQGSYQDPLLHVMMHETTHMWSGNQTTLADTYDFVWKEAYAEYLSYVYEDEHLSVAHSTRTLRIWLSSALEARYHPVPVDEPDLLDYYSDVYGAGPMILGRQLEVLFGREAVLEALRQVLSQPGYLSVDELKLALEGTTGADLTEYFDEWVYGAGAPRWPVLSVGFTGPAADGSYAVQVRQVQNTPFVYGLATTLRVQGAGIGQELEVPISYGVDGDNASLELTINPGFTITSYIVDPYDEALVFGAGVDSERFTAAPIRPF